MPVRYCLNGHKFQVRFGESTDLKRFCVQCGSETTTCCQSCKTPIPESQNLPFYCFNCGVPYPWTESAIKSAILIVKEESAFSKQQITELTESFPNIISETPSTSLASLRIKKALLTAGKFTAEGIRQFVIDFGCELAKKSIGI